MFQKAKQTIDKLLGRASRIHETRHSQPHVLVCRMHQAGLRHEDQALVDLNEIRLVKGKAGNGEDPNVLTVFFCPLDTVSIKQKLKEGDHQQINDRLQVQLIGIKPPKPIGKQQGCYTLKNVLICANGMITIEGTPKTKWEKVSS